MQHKGSRGNRHGTVRRAAELTQKTIKKCPTCNAHFEDYTKDQSMLHCGSTECKNKCIVKVQRVKRDSRIKRNYPIEQKICEYCKNEFGDYNGKMKCCSKPCGSKLLQQKRRELCSNG